MAGAGASGVEQPAGKQQQELGAMGGGGAETNPKPSCSLRLEDSLRNDPAGRASWKPITGSSGTWKLSPSSKLHLHMAQEAAIKQGRMQQRQGAVALPCGVGTDARCLLGNGPDQEREIVSKLYLLNKKMHHWNNISIKNEL